MKLTPIVILAALISAPILAAAQEPTAPAATPRASASAATPRPADAPAPVAEVDEIEIVEPAQSTATREYRIVETDGERVVWVNETGDTEDLGDVMGLALEFNPEIRAIRAEIDALLARLEQLEMKTATDVARKRVEIRRLVDQREHDKELVEKKYKSPRELADLEADLAARELELNYLLGTKPVAAGRLHAPADRLRVMSFSGSGDTLGPASFLRPLGEPRPPLDSIESERLKAVLNLPIQILFEDTSLRDIIEFITGLYELNFTVDLPVRDLLLDINLKDVRLADALGAMSDLQPDLVFIVREYGIFATTRQRALSIPGPSIPDDVPYAKRGSDRPFAPMSAGVLKLKDKEDKQQNDDAPKARNGDERVKFDGLVVPETPLVPESPR